MSHPYENARSPYDKRAKTGRQIADARYGPLDTPSLRTGPLIADAEDVALPKDNYTAAPARQISETGKVRK